MAGTSAFGAPYDRLAHYRAPLMARLHPATSRTTWRRRHRQLRRHVPLLQQLCAHHCEPIAIPPAWPLALLWDELARRDLTERASDWLLGALGRDPSVGLFQITGATAREVVAFASWGASYRGHSLRQLRARLHDSRFAAQIAIGRCQQILHHWRAAGFDPFTPGGLGRHRLRPLGLVGTLYSQGLGRPHAHPRSNARGRQIMTLAAQIRRLWLDAAPARR